MFAGLGISAGRACDAMVVMYCKILDRSITRRLQILDWIG